MWKEKYHSQFSAIKEFLTTEDENFEKEIDSYLASVKKFSKEIATSSSTSRYKWIKESNFENVSTKTIEQCIDKLFPLNKGKEDESKNERISLAS